MAERSFKPQVVEGGTDQDPESHEDHHTEQPADFTRCARCHERMIRRPGRDTHAHCQPLDDTQRSAS